MNLELLLKILLEYGPIFNTVHHLIDSKELVLPLEDEEYFIEEIQTCCYKTVELLRDLLTDGKIYYYSEQLVNINSIYAPSFLILEINDVAEIGSHYMGIIYTQNKTFLIQSFGFRYSYIVSQYNSLEELLLYCDTMINTNNPLLKLEMYNNLTHNKATLENYNVLLDPRYERHESLNIKAFHLMLPSLNQLLEYLNEGLRISNDVLFMNIAKNIIDAIEKVNIYNL